MRSRIHLHHQAPLLSRNSHPSWVAASRPQAIARNNMVLPQIQTRYFFGIGEIVGVITNPGEVLRSLSESKKLLEEARQEMKDNSERKQIPKIHAFSPLPGFYDRPTEVMAIERALGGVPAFTVLFGASSVGKTALLRQVLSSSKYHVLHFDLRIAGFADLSSLYLSLATQLEGYFASLPGIMGNEWGWGEFEKESWAFKHDRIAIEKRMEGGGVVKTSDIAHLMELFQSALLKYWEFEPMTDEARKQLQAEETKANSTLDEDASGTLAAENLASVANGKRTLAHDETESTMREGWGAPAVNLQEARTVNKGKSEEDNVENTTEKEEQSPQPPSKRIPVLFIDEAHKLPALIQADDAMKCLLDAMLVLTKQDRLCHVFLNTSDAFFMHWLRQLNIMQHCHILSVGDCSKTETLKYFEEHLLPHVPDRLAGRITFEGLYRVFGGKLAHFADYMAEFINSDGDILPSQSSHFLQAHSLLNLQLIHSMPTPDGAGAGSGFEIYSPIKQGSPHAAPSPFDAPPSPGSDFSNQDLLRVMRLFQPDDESASTQDSPSELSYFRLCRELGAKAVDGLVRAKILELRWCPTATEEGDSSNLVARRKTAEVGPVLVPTTPVVRYGMAWVLKEYEGRAELPSAKIAKQ